jgi:hypothetical protein
MQGKKPGWISNPERAAITALLATDDLGGLAAEPLQDEEQGEAGIELLPIAHGGAMAAAFFVLGIAMALSGLRRLFDKKKIFPRFPGSFAWQRHVLKGKIYIACALAGLGVGLSIWALDGFSIGALPHFAIGCGVGLLFAVGGAAGLRMARSKGTPALCRLHAICNLAATALFTINIVSGLSLVWPLFMW